MSLVFWAGLARAGSLEAGFHDPPDSARPHTWWHWMNGNVTREGITADLEAMKRVGIGEAQIFNADCGIPAGPVKFMSPEWRELVKYAAQEAQRLGLELCMHNCAGWSSSGGPWNTPEHAMQMVTTSERRVKGPALFRRCCLRRRRNSAFIVILRCSPSRQPVARTRRPGRSCHGRRSLT